MKMGSFSVALLVSCIVLISGCTNQRDQVPVDKQNLKGHGEIYFVPLGNFSATTVDDLTTYYQNKYGISIKTLPNVPLNPSVIDVSRDQLIAERAVELMRYSNPSLAHNRKAILIGLTNRDMYIAQFDWNFAFSIRQDERFVVVSDARMRLDSAYVPPEKIEERLRKMVTKNIGVLYYRLPESDDPQSVLYGNILSLMDLDRMGEEF